MTRRPRLPVAGALMFCVCGFAQAQEWTRFRGPNGSGISQTKTIPVAWTESDYGWITELPGSGHSSPVVWGDKVFVTSAEVEPAVRHLLCINAADGSLIWQREFPFQAYKHHKNNSSASSTPAVDADRVYVLWQSREGSPLVALTHDGEEVWRYDLGPYVHGQGAATSPIVYNDMVVVCNDHSEGSFLLAVDRKSGKELWKTPREGKRACYATPCVFHAEGRPDELIFSHCFEGIVGVEPSSGRQKWMIDVFGTHPQRAVGSPILWRDMLIANSGGVGGEKNVVAVRPPSPNASRPVEQVYRISRNAPHVPTTIVHDGLLFLWSDVGIVTCVEAESGQVVWEHRVGGNYFSSPICVNGKLYAVELDGQVVVLEASRQYALLAKNPLPHSSRSTPAVSGGRMFIRTYSHLYALGGE